MIVALNKAERMLLESIKSMLKHDSKLGLAIHDNNETEQQKHDWRGDAYLHEQIEDMFQVKAAELVHAESIYQAFNKVHSYKYLDDPTFSEAMSKEMTATAVPASERIKALNFIQEIIEELKAEQLWWAEKDAGFNPKLDEIRDISKPEQPLNFEIQTRSLNNRNIKTQKYGNGSPERTSMTQPPLPSEGHDAESNQD
jgi:hypothetical protein